MTAATPAESRPEGPTKTSIGKLAFFLLVLAGVFIFVANLLIWIEITVFDSDEFANVTESTLAKPEVQEHVGEQLAARVVQSDQLTQRVQEQLPANLASVAPVLVEQLEPVIANVATRLMASELTGQIAAEAIPRLHSELLAILEDDETRLAVQGDSLVLNLGGQAEKLAARLGIERPEAEGGGSPSGEVVLLEDATYLELTSVLVKNRQEITLVLLIGALAALALAAWRIRNASVTLRRVSIVAVAVGVFTVLVVLVSNWILADVFPHRVVARELLKSAEENLVKQSLLLLVLGAVGIAATDAGVRKLAVEGYSNGGAAVSGAIERMGIGRLMLLAAAAAVVLVLLL
jgi:hypothetical protein